MRADYTGILRGWLSPGSAGCQPARGDPLAVRRPRARAHGASATHHAPGRLEASDPGRRGHRPPGRVWTSAVMERRLPAGQGRSVEAVIHLHLLHEHQPRTMHPPAGRRRSHRPNPPPPSFPPRDPPPRQRRREPTPPAPGDGHQPVAICPRIAQVLPLEGGPPLPVLRHHLPPELAHHPPPGVLPLARQAGGAQLDAVVEPAAAAGAHLETAGGDEVTATTAEGAFAVGVGVAEDEEDGLMSGFRGIGHGVSWGWGSSPWD